MCCLFFKQKTAYDMRIIDWSSDVCSSDLTLKTTRQVGIARVVIRTREYLAAVMPQGDALLLMLLRYPQELVDPADYKLPEGKPASYRVTAKEMDMAKRSEERRGGKECIRTCRYW